jgi:hypothetical protein
MHDTWLHTGRAIQILKILRTGSSEKEKKNRFCYMTANE